MSLRFILGRAGSGKTTYTLDNIREELKKSPEGNNLILLVPEQATFQNEMELAKTPGIEGIMRAQVLSFRRLAWRVLQEVGGGSRVHIGELGKHMVIRQFLEQRKEELKVFTGASDKPGFVEALAGAISELKLYQISVQELKNILKEETEWDSLLISKLWDLQLIYQDLQNYLANRYIDPDDYLNLLAERVHLAPSIINAEIWIDGFTGFTPQELKVIEGLFQSTQRVNVALTLDSGNLAAKGPELFNVTEETYGKISRLAERKGIPIERPVILEQPVAYRFQNSSSLAFLEKAFFDLGAEVYNDDVHDIKIINAQNHRAEVEAIAREIRTLCREKGYRYGDIAVILRDFANYDLLIETVFSDYDIPFFMDRKRTVMHHPLVELIRSALEVVQENWTYQSVFRYLKTDLANIERSKVDDLENYVLAHGIKGQAWYKDKPWQYRKKYELNGKKELTKNEEKKLVYINRIRWQAIKELKVFVEKIEQAENTTEIAQGIFELLNELKVPYKLEWWAEEAYEQGRLEACKEHKQIWDGIVDILDQVVETLGEQKISLDAFIKILDSGLESLKLGLIPPGLDQVVIGSLERSRNPNLQAVFVLGVSDGILPARPVAEGLFNDNERELLKDLGLELAPGSREKLFNEEFLVYTALTRASKHLVLSYPLADAEGKALRPSLVIKRIKELFPKLVEINLGIEPVGEIDNDLDFISHPRRALAYLGAKLRQAKEGQPIDPLWWDVYYWLLHDARGKEGLEKVIKGLFHTNQVNPINPALAKKLFGNPLRVSVSRLEKFQACPFAHFANYGLRLQEREVFRLSQPDLGQFFHAALEQFANRLAEQDIDWSQLGKKEIIETTNEIAEKLVPQLQSEILLSSARYRYLTKKFKKTVQRAASVLVEHARRGKFRPLGLEIAFGPGGRLPGLKLTLNDGTEMELVGRIDRVDGAKKEDKYFLRVIDYKSGSAGLSLLEVFYGFKLQLIAYLDIILTYREFLLDSENAVPAGILYFYLKDPLVTGKGPLDEEKIENEIIKQLKMQGLVLADLDVIQLTDGETTSGHSPIIPVAINKDGRKLLEEGKTAGADINPLDLFYKNSSVASLEQIELLRKHIREVLCKTGETILQGEAAVSPYQLKGFKACQYCSFQVVCQFDTQIEGNTYRDMQEIEDEEIWGKLRGKD